MASGDEVWEIPLPKGRAHFEKQLESHVTMVERLGSDQSVHSIAFPEMYGHLEHDWVVLLSKPKSRSFFQKIPFLLPYEKAFVFQGQYEASNSHLVVRGPYKTQSWLREVILGFLILWLVLCVIGAVVGLITIIDVFIEDASLLTLVIGLIVYPVVVAGLVVWAAVGVFMTRFFIEVHGLGRSGRPTDLLGLLKQCAS